MYKLCFYIKSLRKALIFRYALWLHLPLMANCGSVIACYKPANTCVFASLAFLLSCVFSMPALASVMPNPRDQYTIAMALQLLVISFFSIIIVVSVLYSTHSEIWLVVIDLLRVAAP